MHSKNLFKILFSLLLGSLIGVFLCNYTFFEYDFKISLFDVFSLFLTTGVGIYIALIITKSINSNSAEKQLLISELNNVLTLIEKLNLDIDNKSLPILITNNILKKINTRIIFFEKILLKSHCRSIRLDNCKSNIKTLRTSITFYSKNKSFAFKSVQDHLIAQNIIQELKGYIYDLILEINKK